MKKIDIHSVHIQSLSKTHEVSEQTVRMALQYVFNSEKSRKIRLGAAELLKQQAEDIIKEEDNYTQAPKKTEQ